VGEAAKKKALDELAKAKIVLLDHTSGDPLNRGWIQGCNRVLLPLFLSSEGKKKSQGKAAQRRPSIHQDHGQHGQLPLCHDCSNGKGEDAAVRECVAVFPS
jgi:hypothetical protein